MTKPSDEIAAVGLIDGPGDSGVRNRIAGGVADDGAHLEGAADQHLRVIGEDMDDGGRLRRSGGRRGRGAEKSGAASSPNLLHGLEVRACG